MKLEFDPVADVAYFEISSAVVEETRGIELGIIVDKKAAEEFVRIASKMPGKSDNGYKFSRDAIYDRHAD